MKNKKIKLTKPNAKPEEVQSIGVSEQFTRVPIDQKRAEEIQNIINNPDQGYSKPVETILKKETDYSSYIPKISKEELIKRDLLMRAPDEWNFFGVPDAETMDMLIRSIANDGLLTPLIVWEQADGKYMILSGHTRELCYDSLYQATGDEKYQTIPCKIYKKDDINETIARRIIIISNVAQRAKESPKLRIKSFGELAMLEKEKSFYGSGIDVANIVADLCGCSRATVFFYKRIKNLITPFLNEFCNEELSRRAADILSTLDEKLQYHIYNNAYHIGVSSQKLTNFKKAQTTEDIDKIMKQIDKPSKEQTSYQINIGFTKPKSASIVPVVVDKKDIEQFKTALSRLMMDEQLSAKTKEYIGKLLNI